MVHLRLHLHRAALWRQWRTAFSRVSDGDLERGGGAEPSGVSRRDQLEEPRGLHAARPDRSHRPAISQQLRFFPQHLGAAGALGQRAITIKNYKLKMKKLSVLL